MNFKTIFLAILLLIPFNVSAADLIQSVNIKSPVSSSAIDHSSNDNYAISGRDHSSNDNYAMISWEQSQSVIMNVFICNLDGIVVKTIHKNKKGEPGTQQYKWDLRDDMGNPCPAGAYIPIIKLKTQNSDSDIYNPSTSTWGTNIVVDDWSYDVNSKKITYSLPKKALCLMRIGEKDGGPIYLTLFEWQPMNAGTHEVPWNGKDTQNLVDVHKKEKLMVFVDAIELPENSIIIKESNNKSHAFTGIKKRFALNPPKARDINLHALHQRQFCHELLMSVNISGDYKQKEGLPIINSNTEFMLNRIEPEGLEPITREPFEHYIFVDGKLLYEGPQKEFPGVIKVDTQKATPGKHILTINMRTAEDHVGTYSMHVWINK